MGVVAYLFAEAVPAESIRASTNPSILDTLGINPQLLIMQIVAFLILVVLLGKYVFPVFIKIIDKRQAAIEQSNKAAIEAGKHAEKAQQQIADMLKAAKDEASGIVATAKSEATSLLERAEHRSKAQAEAIVTAAKSDIEKQVLAAKKALHNETIELVAAATEKVIGQKVTASTDSDIIAKAIKEAE